MTQMALLLLLVLAVAVVACLPRWSHSRRWGYLPASFFGLLLIAMIGLLIIERIAR